MDIDQNTYKFLSLQLTLQKRHGSLYNTVKYLFKKDEHIKNRLNNYY